jgi:hypothetical protein
MNVSRHDYFIAFFAGGKHHALNRGCCAAHHQECVACAERICRKLFSILDHRHRMGQIIKRLHRIHIDRKTPLAEKVSEIGISLPALMAGNIEGNHARGFKLNKRLEERRTILR